MLGSGFLAFRLRAYGFCLRGESMGLEFKGLGLNSSRLLVLVLGFCARVRQARVSLLSQAPCELLRPCLKNTIELAWLDGVVGGALEISAGARVTPWGLARPAHHPK